jgi:hypothetical protein
MARSVRESQRAKGPSPRVSFKGEEQHERGAVEAAEGLGTQGRHR